MPDQQVVNQIRADDVEFRFTAKRQASQVALKDADAFGHAVLKSIRLRNADGRRVEVEGLDRTVTQLGRSDGKNSGAGADVQKGLRLS